MKPSLYLRRATRLDRLDFDNALSQMLQLLSRPSLVFRAAKVRKMTKNFYAREEPAFVLLQLAFLAAASLAWGLTFHVSLSHLLHALLLHLCGFYLTGCVLFTTFLWYGCNRYIRTRRPYLNEVRRDVEWLYCWDIATSAFFPPFLLLYVVQHYLLWLVLRPGILACLCANTLWALASSYWGYIVYRGLLELPLLPIQPYMLLPLGVVWLVGSGLATAGHNITALVLTQM